MANEIDDKAAHLGRVLDYKTLSVAACALVVILGGGLIGLWNHGIEQALYRLTDTSAKQWERISQLQDRLGTATSRIEQLEKYTEDQEQRIRLIERSFAFGKQR